VKMASCFWTASFVKLAGAVILPLLWLLDMVMKSSTFTFFDQVHTTGMDIKQSINARAAVTLGKDMAWRDFAQGCWGMRGLGKGQTVHMIVVKEVEKRIRRISPKKPHT